MTSVIGILVLTILLELIELIIQAAAIETSAGRRQIIPALRKIRQRVEKGPAIGQWRLSRSRRVKEKKWLVIPRGDSRLDLVLKNGDSIAIT